MGLNVDRMAVMAVAENASLDSCALLAAVARATAMVAAVVQMAAEAAVILTTAVWGATVSMVNVRRFVLMSAARWSVELGDAVAPAEAATTQTDHKQLGIVNLAVPRLTRSALMVFATMTVGTLANLWVAVTTPVY